MTFGAGGHTKAILEKNPNSIVYTLDRDPFAYNLAKQLKEKFP
jgi:16S rRNA C1402 N4-methylase RsmH